MTYQVSLFLEKFQFHIINFPFSVLLVNSPINSTQVDPSTSEAGNHHQLELSRIEPAGVSLPTATDEATTEPRPPTPAAPPSQGSPPSTARDLTSLAEEDMILASVRSSETSNQQGVYRCKCGKECTRFGFLNNELF